MTLGADMLLFSGAILFGAAASDAAEPTQDPPELPAPWPLILPAAPPAVIDAAPAVSASSPSLAELPPQRPPLSLAPPDGPPPGDVLPEAPTTPPGAPPPIAILLAALVGTPPPSALPTPPGAPPPGTGTLDFDALLALLLKPVVEPTQPVGEIPPPFLPPAPIADVLPGEPWGLRDWSLL